VAASIVIGDIEALFQCIHSGGETVGQYHKVVDLDNEEVLNPQALGDGLKLFEFGSSGCGTMAGLAVLLRLSPVFGLGDIPKHQATGKWAGHRIVICGDYGDGGKFVTAEQIAAYAKTQDGKAARVASAKEKPPLYAVAGQTFKDVSNLAIEAMCGDRELRKALIERTQWSRKIPGSDPLDCFSDTWMGSTNKLDRSAKAKGQSFLIANLTKKQTINPLNFGEDTSFKAFATASDGSMFALSCLLADSNGRGGGDVHSEHGLISSWAGDQIAIVGSFQPMFPSLSGYTDVSDKMLTALTEDAWYAKEVFPRIAQIRSEAGRPIAPQEEANIAGRALGAVSV
jgi:hypothetical protein